MKKIIWIGDEREIPNIGVLKEGDIREVEDIIAVGFITQGQAKEYKEKAIKPEAKPKEMGEK